MADARWRSFGGRLTGRWRSRRCCAGRRQVVDTGIRRHDELAGIRRHDEVAGVRRHDGVARACDALGPASGTTVFRAPKSDRSDSHQIKFPISRNEGFTESNLLGEKAA